MTFDKQSNGRRIEVKFEVVTSALSVLRRLKSIDLGMVWYTRV